MQYASIAVNGIYALVLDGQPLSEPLCVEVVAMDSPRGIKTKLLYPPIEPTLLGADLNIQATSSEIQGPWDERAQDRDGVQLQRTWKAIATEQWARTLRQHELVDRLAAFGIHRAPKLYGGLPVRISSPTLLPPNVSTALNLTFDELERLLAAAEGLGAVAEES